MRFVFVLAWILLLGCPSTADDDDSTEDDSWTLEIVNDSAVTIDLVQQRSCPSTGDWTEMALQAGGIGPGDRQRFGLPTPSCFSIAMEGGGCFYETTTGSLELGDQVTITVQDDDITCVGR